MDFLIWEKEIGEEGTPHIQGYVRFKVRKTLQGAKRLICAEAHLEPARGSEGDNIVYCSKDRAVAADDWGEFGVPDPNIRQGRRTDLEAVISDVIIGSPVHLLFLCLMKVAGQPLHQIAQCHPQEWIKYHNGIVDLHRQLAPAVPIRRDVHTTILWGTTGVGKSHRVLSKYPDSFIVLPGRDPFGSYCGEKTVIFEEFDFEKWTIQEMNRFLDVWKCKLDCRYFDKHAMWNKVFIISNLHPDKWYLYCREELRAAFFRRITATYEVVSKEQVIDI